MEFASSGYDVSNNFQLQLVDNNSNQESIIQTTDFYHTDELLHTPIFVEENNFQSSGETSSFSMGLVVSQFYQPTDVSFNQANNLSFDQMIINNNLETLTRDYHIGEHPLAEWNNLDSIENRIYNNLNPGLEWNTDNYQNLQLVNDISGAIYKRIYGCLRIVESGNYQLRITSDNDSNFRWWIKKNGKYQVLIQTINDVSGTSVDGSETSFTDLGFIPVGLNEETKLDTTRIVASEVNELSKLTGLFRNKSLTTRIAMSNGGNFWSSPMLCLDTAKMLFSSNRLNKPIADYSIDPRANVIYGDLHTSYYMSKIIKIKQPATSLKVIFDAFRPASVDFRVMYSLIRGDSSEVDNEIVMINALTKKFDGASIDEEKVHRSPSAIRTETLSYTYKRYANGRYVRDVNHNITLSLSVIPPKRPLHTHEFVPVDLNAKNQDVPVDLNVKNTAKIFWLIDPIDGTKEYIAGKDEYTLNAALVINTVPVLGLVGVPKKNRLFYTYAPGESYLIQSGNTKKINCTKQQPKGKVVALSSVLKPSDLILNKLKEFNVNSIVKMASSYKFCVIATGEYDVYAAKERANEWDYAAGHAVAQNAGAIIKTLDEKPFLYGKEDYKNPSLLIKRAENLND